MSHRKGKHPASKATTYEFLLVIVVALVAIFCATAKGI